MPLLSPGQLEIQATARKLARSVLLPNAETVDRNRQFPADNLAAIGKTGLLGVTVPRAYGGLGGGPQEHAVVCEAFGWGCSSTAMCFLMHAVGCHLISSKATPEQAERWLAPAASGRTLATLAFSEAAAGASFTKPDITARKVTGGFVLRGRKAFVTNGGHASLYPVLANASNGRGLTVLVITPDLPGVSFDGAWNGIGMSGNSSINMALEEVFVPEQNLLGEDGQGEDLLYKVSRPYFYAGLSAVNIGIATSAFEVAVEHVKARRHNTGRALAEIPAVQAHIAQMSTELEAARLLVYEAARAYAAGEPESGALLMQAKLAATEAARSVTQRAMQVGGGMAYGRALPIERSWRDAQAGIVMVPANDALKETLGKLLTGLPDH